MVWIHIIPRRGTGHIERNRRGDEEGDRARGKEREGGRENVNAKRTRKGREGCGEGGEGEGEGGGQRESNMGSTMLAFKSKSLSESPSPVVFNIAYRGALKFPSWQKINQEKD